MSLFIAVLVVIPVAVVGSALLTPTPEVWRHIWATRLPEMILNTIWLLLGVGFGTLVLGTGLAWLVTAYRFPGRAAFDWLLILPMAIPAYVIGFVYMATLDFAGPVQKILRNWFNSNIWFPEIRSGGGVVVVMSLVFYPYVYLAARAAFFEQSATTFDAARVLGHSRMAAFFHVALPMARPTIVAGLTLAMMEALTDIGTVRFFNFPTLSDGIFRIWHGMMSREAAIELAGVLLLFALAVILLERRLRGRARFYQDGGRDRGITPVYLSGRTGWAATVTCAIVLAFAFALPIVQLLSWASSEVAQMASGALEVLYWRYTGNSILLSGVATGITVLVVMLLASGVRLSDSSRLSQLAARLATIGYAIPGAVIGLGVLISLAPLDHAINNLAQKWWNVNPGLLLIGSTAGLTYAYVVRFMNVAYNSVEASLQKISPNIDGAARTLGASPKNILWNIHLPLVRTGIFTGAVLVFVDVMKELPITLLLRPFGYDTLAIWVWQMISEGFWASAALPSLTIVAAGLLPVVLLMHAATPSKRHPSEQPSAVRHTEKITTKIKPAGMEKHVERDHDGSSDEPQEFSLSLVSVEKRFGNVLAVNDISLEVAPGEILVILGPSGCGKTTLLRLIAGLETPDQGIIKIGGQTVAGPTIWLPPEARSVGLVFQDYALFPHMTVSQNVSFGLKHLPVEQQRKVTENMLQLVNMKSMAHRYPHQLSGGEQQRVGLARALAPRPSVLLLDESFSNLDPELRSRMRLEVRSILQQANTTTILVTHDQEEANILGDRVAVLNQGRLEQVDSPENLYHQPASPFVAQFVGHADFIPGIVDGCRITTELGDFKHDGASTSASVDVMVRPDEISITPDESSDAVIIGKEFQGSENMYTILLASGNIVRSKQPSTLVYSLGLKVRVKALLRHVVVFPQMEIL